ncbi:MAG: hypothetical protein B6245_17955 [Desulfobacteraceae bacterium 4572_88]|nr:MAG: hypothetical protein B6245_17955 [Desulfobacteraceae bacterium 4572_88]
MDNLKLEATKYTPEIAFDCENHLLEIIGESYPENIAEFYAPVFEWLEAYLGQLGTQDVTVNMELIYFNSSSSKVLLDLFELLEDAVDDGKKITVNWIYEPEDEDTLEFGEEFQEDFESLTINLLEKSS